MRIFRDVRNQVRVINVEAKRSAACNTLQMSLDGITRMRNADVQDGTHPTVAAQLEKAAERGARILLGSVQANLTERGCSAVLSIVEGTAGHVAMAKCTALDCPLIQE